MRIQIDNHLWTLEGDLEASVFLDLVFDVRLAGHTVDAVELIRDDTELQGVTFARGDHEIICDGVGTNPELPDRLWLWFIERFHAAWDADEAMRTEVTARVAARAVATSYEMQAA